MRMPSLYLMATTEVPVTMGELCKSWCWSASHDEDYLTYVVCCFPAAEESVTPELAPAVAVALAMVRSL